MYIKKIYEKILNKFGDEIEKQSLTNFDEYFKKILHYTERTILLEKDRPGFRKSQKEIATEITADLLIYKDSSFIKNIDKIETEDFEVFQYSMRTETFREKYGNEKVKIGTTTKSLDDWYEDFVLGNISKKKMNRVIKKLKNSPQQYKAGS